MSNPLNRSSVHPLPSDITRRYSPNTIKKDEGPELLKTRFEPPASGPPVLGKKQLAITFSAALLITAAIVSVYLWADVRFQWNLGWLDRLMPIVGQ